MKNQIQELKKKLEVATNEERVVVLNQLGYIFQHSNPSQAEQYLKQALLLAQKLNFQDGMATSYRILGVVESLRNDYEEALKNFLAALEIVKDLDDKQNLAEAYNHLGLIYKYLNQYEKSLSYLQAALSIYQKLEHKRGISDSYINLGLIYQHLQQPEKAFAYHQQALIYFDEINDQHGIALCYNNIGICLDSQKKYDQALTYHFQALHIRKEHHDIYGLISSYINIGEVQIKIGQYDLAVDHLQKGVELSQEMGIKQWEMNAYQQLAKLYEIQQNYQKSLYYYKKYTKLERDIFNAQKNKQITEMQTKYEIQTKEYETEMYRRLTNELEKKIVERTGELKNALEKEKELSDMKSKFIEVASHEFRTPLTVIAASTYVLHHQKSKLNAEKEDQLFEMINESIQNITTLIDNIMITHTLNIENMVMNPFELDFKELCEIISKDFQTQNYPDRELIFTVNDENNLLYRCDTTVVTRMLHHLLANAFKFSTDEVCISLGFQTDHIILTITDKGIGIPLADQDRIFNTFYRADNAGTIPGIGVGLFIVKKIVQAMKGEITVHSDGENKGSTFVVELPRN